MATCATLGEAAGIGAALALQTGASGRELATDRLGLVRNALTRADASVLALINDDPADLGLQAEATASSTTRRLAPFGGDGRYPLTADLGVIVPLDPEIGTFEVLADVTEDTTLTVEVWSTSKPQNYLPSKLIESHEVRATRGEDRWLTTGLAVSGGPARNLFLVLRSNPHIVLHTTDDTLPGTLFFLHRLADPDDVNGLYFREWKGTLQHASICYRVSATTDAYRAGNVLGGYARPFGGPNLWASEHSSLDPRPWIELTWPTDVTFREVVVVADDDVDEDLINLHHHFTAAEIMPTLIRDYVLEIHDGVEWRTLCEITENRRRTARHALDSPVTTQRLRLRVQSTNGAARAHVVAIRVYLNADADGAR